MCADTAHNRHRIDRLILQYIVVNLESMKDNARSLATDALIDFLQQVIFNISVFKEIFESSTDFQFITRKVHEV